MIHDVYQKNVIDKNSTCCNIKGATAGSIAPRRKRAEERRKLKTRARSKREAVSGSKGGAVSPVDYRFRQVGRTELQRRRPSSGDSALRSFRSCFRSDAPPAILAMRAMASDDCCIETNLASIESFPAEKQANSKVFNWLVRASSYPQKQRSMKRRQSFGFPTHFRDAHGSLASACGLRTCSLFPATILPDWLSADCA
jgi:hypothetical protein